MDVISERPLEFFEVGPCNGGFEMGFLIGQRFADLIKSRVVRDLVLQEQLLPFARTPQAQPLIEALSTANKKRFPTYWDELLGLAEGSGVSTLDIILLNFRKEILPFVTKAEAIPEASGEDCSDVLVVNEAMAIAAHNEDANIALVGHTYFVKATLPNGSTFTAYTYAGELPSCAFGFNSHGLAFTLNAVPPADEEIIATGIGRNFVSRDLLEATGLEDALTRIHTCNASVGHSYNLVEVKSRRILNVETASDNRCSVHEIGANPFFHANAYLHLQVQQVHNENSISRQRRAGILPAESKAEVLSVLGDCKDKKFPIYMTGPTLYTLCTVLIDVDEKTLSIYGGNPKNGKVSHVLPIVEDAKARR